MAKLSIRLFGGLSVEYAGEERASRFSGRLRSLLALLLTQANRPHARQSVAFALWPDSSEKQARTNLRKLLLLLRAALGPAADRLLTTDETLSWHSQGHCWLDTGAFAELLDNANNAPVDAAIALLGEAADLYRGDLLPDCYDEWIVAARETLRDGYINALEQLCMLYQGERRYAEGVAVARRLLQHDPMYERGHLHLVTLQALMNDRSGALQSYHRCATLLRRELGVDPSPALEAFYLQLLDHDLPAPMPSAPEAQAAIPMVGRRAAWQQLLDQWQQTQQGHAHFALIVGEAGIGKSRLAEEMMLWVERQGNTVVHARAYSSDNRTLTFAPVAGWLRAPAVRRELDKLEPYWLTEVARLLPELLLERDDVRPPQPMVDDWQRHHLFAALTQALQPGQRPRLLVIDDLQWSDSETLAWLPHLLEHAKAARLLVVGTVRSEEFDDYAALQALCETLRRRRQLDEIELGPLSAPEIAQLARHVVGQSLSATHAEWLAHATEGNPLFVVEMAHLLHDDCADFAFDSTSAPGAPLASCAAGDWGAMRDLTGRDVTGFSLLPKSVLAVIEARLDRLSKDARLLAEVAATIGRDFALSVLAAASALDENELMDALDELWRRRIIREREGGDYDFSHDRIRDGAYAGISPLRRRLLHKRVAAALIETQRGALDEVSGQLGYHYEQANERLSAIKHFMTAGTVAAGGYALAEAMYYFDRVLTLALPDELAVRFEATRHRDRMIELSGTVDVWEENVRQLRQLAETPDADPQVVMRRRALAAERASRAFARLYNPQRAVEEARRSVEYATQTDDLQVQAMCYQMLGLRLWYVADFPAAVPNIERAIELARQVNDYETLAHALELRAQTHMFDGGTAHVIMRLLEECLVNYDKVGSLLGRIQILNKLGYIHFAQGTGSYAGSVAALQEAIDLAKRIGSLNAEVHPQRNLAITYTCMGNYTAADTALARAQANLHAIGALGQDGTLLNYRGFLCLSQGRLQDALELQQRALVALAAQNFVQWRVKALTALAWIHLRLERPDEALAYAELARAESAKINERRQYAYTLTVCGILRTDAGELAVARDNFAEARTILRGYEMYNRALEAEAGLAYLDFLEGEHPAALRHAHFILAHLEAHPVDFTEDVCQLLLTCWRILQRLDCRALPALNRVIDLHLATRTATLDAATAALFWQIPAHQSLAAAVQHIAPPAPPHIEIGLFAVPDPQVELIVK